MSGSIPATPLASRLAGAPISFGVCEVPGWGLQLDPDDVFGEMSSLGLAATEAGPVGYLPGDPNAARELLADHGLQLVGGFLPVVLHDPGCAEEQLAFATAQLEWLSAAGARYVTTAPVVDAAWSPRVELEPAAWNHLLGMLDRVGEVCAERGLVQAVHPHVGTLVQTAAEVQRVLDGSGAGLCLDTGHLTIGGADPAALLREHPQRFVHVHLKDVDAGLADRVAGSEVSLVDATRRGLFRALGDGDAPVAEVIGILERTGYPGWIVLEQDCALEGRPAAGAGPVADLVKSIAFVRSATAALAR